MAIETVLLESTPDELLLEDNTGLLLESSSNVYSLPIDSATFSTTGQAVGLKSGRAVSIANGSFTSTAQDATLTYVRKISIAVGSFITNAQTAVLRKTTA